MKPDCNWHDEAKTIIVARPHPNSTWDDAYTGADEISLLIKSVPHNVYVIMDLTLSSTLPQGVAFPNLQRLINKRLPNQQLTIFVGIGFLMQKFMDMARSMFGLTNIFNTYRFVNTMDEALLTIENHKQKQQAV